MLILGEAGIVVDLAYVARGIAQFRIEILLLKQHGVLVAREHFHAFRLISTGETIGIGHLGTATRATLGFDFDNSIGALRSPDGSGGCILEHGDGLDVVGVDVEQLSELLVVGTRKVQVLVGLPHITVDNDQWVGRHIDRRHATQVHACAGTQVT